MPGGDDSEQEAAPREYGRLIRKHILPALLLMLVGGGLGTAAAIWTTPVYRARTLLEVQRFNESFVMLQALAPEGADQINIQTQIRILTAGTFLKKILERLQLESIPPPPPQADTFSRLRRKFRPESQDPILQMRRGLETAAMTFDARPVNGTRLIEITCESTNPDVAATFLTTASSEYIDEAVQVRAEVAQRTGQWIGGQLEETKNKLQEAEKRLQAYVKQSGNLFVAQESTLADAKLRQLQAELSSIQADRIGKQARHEMAAKASPETLPDVVDDSNLRTYRSRLVELRRELAALTATLTDKNARVIKVQAQVTEVEGALNAEIAKVKTRIQNDFEAAQRRENLLSRAYSGQAGQVSSQAGRAADFDALRREVDMLRQSYAAMLQQNNQANLSYSIPVSNIRVVEPARPPDKAVRPVPPVNIGMGLLMGLMAGIGLAFVREHLDTSVRSPGLGGRAGYRVPEIGVIPTVVPAGPGWRRLPLVSRMLPPDTSNLPALLAPGLRQGFVSDPANPAQMHFSESFRSIVAGLKGGWADAEDMRQVILITSPEPGDGKSTIASNLALALAESGQSVLLIDADFRRPTLHRAFGLDNGAGLSSLLSEEASAAPGQPRTIGEPTSYPGLFVLVNGPPVGNLSKTLHSPALRAILRQARQQFETVIVDAPPLHFADARVVGKSVDGVLLVVRAGTTGVARAYEACRCLHEDRIRVLGTVLNDWSSPKFSAKQYYNAYYKRDAERD